MEITSEMTYDGAQAEGGSVEMWRLLVTIDDKEEKIVDDIAVDLNPDTVVCNLLRTSCEHVDHADIPFKTYPWPKTGHIHSAAIEVALRYWNWMRTNVG